MTTASTTGYVVRQAGSGVDIIKFNAASNTDANTIAQSLATLFAITIDVYGLGVAGEGPTTFTPGSQGTTVGCPSGVRRLA